MLPYYVIVPLEGATGGVQFREIATEESRAHYASIAQPHDSAAGKEVDPPACVAQGAASTFYAAAMQLIDDRDPSVLAAVSAAWNKKKVRQLPPKPAAHALAKPWLMFGLATGARGT